MKKTDIRAILEQIVTATTETAEAERETAGPHEMTYLGVPLRWQ
ncbi:unnamed protein product, partial [marine sediment metagenome]